MFDSNKALDKNISKSSLNKYCGEVPLIEKINDHDDNFLGKIAMIAHRLQAGQMLQKS